jgi:hypothetical protein
MDGELRCYNRSRGFPAPLHPANASDHCGGGCATGCAASRGSGTAQAHSAAQPSHLLLLCWAHPTTAPNGRHSLTTMVAHGGSLGAGDGVDGLSKHLQPQARRRRRGTQAWVLIQLAEPQAVQRVCINFEYSAESVWTEVRLGSGHTSPGTAAVLSTPRKRIAGTFQCVIRVLSSYITGKRIHACNCCKPHDTPASAHARRQGSARALSCVHACHATPRREASRRAWGLSQELSSSFFTQRT